MPTYEYACRTCGEHLEVVQSFKDEPLSECPNCGGSLRKVFGSIGITFKGSGFYKTDSRSSGSAKPAASASTDSTSESKSEKSGKPEKSDGKSDSKSTSSSSSSSDSGSSSSSSSSKTESKSA